MHGRTCPVLVPSFLSILTALHCTCSKTALTWLAFQATAPICIFACGKVHWAESQVHVLSFLEHSCLHFDRVFNYNDLMCLSQDSGSHSVHSLVGSMIYARCVLLEGTSAFPPTPGALEDWYRMWLS